MGGAEGHECVATGNQVRRLREISTLTPQEHGNFSVATRPGYFFCVAAYLVIFLSCTSASNTPTAPSGASTPNNAERNGGMPQTVPNEVSTDVEALSRLITLPAPPVSAVWRRQVRGTPNSRVPGPTDWYLEALLTFDQDDAEKIAKEAKKLEKLRDIDSIEGVDWLPAETRQNLEAVPNTPKYKVKGEAYPADAFAKTPLLNGYLVRLGESPQFFLKLYTQ